MRTYISRVIRVLYAYLQFEGYACSLCVLTIRGLYVISMRTYNSRVIRVLYAYLQFEGYT